VTKAVAQFRIEIDWADDGYQHAFSDVTAYSQGMRFRYGNDLEVSSKEAPIQFGDGRLQLEARGGVFGPGGSVSRDQLGRVHAIRIFETTTNTHVYTGLVEFQDEFYARILDGDLLNFQVRGRGWKRDGGVLTYPKGAADGQSLEAGLAVRRSEPRVVPQSGTVTQSVPIAPAGSWGAFSTLLDGRVVAADGRRLLAFTLGQLPGVAVTPPTFGTAVRDETVEGTAGTRAPTTTTTTTQRTIFATGQVFTTTATQTENVPAIRDEEERNVAWLDDPLIHDDGVLWRVKHVTGRRFDYVPAGGYSSTEQTSTSVTVRNTSWPYREFNIRTLNHYELEGRRLTNTSGGLELETGPVLGGVIPSTLALADAVIAHEGGLFAVQGGQLWSVTGMPASVEVTARGALPPGCNTPKTGASFGGRMYLIGNDAHSVWHVGQPESPNAATNIGSFATNTVWDALGFDSDDYGWWSVAQRRTGMTERFQTTNAPVEQGQTEPDLAAVVDVLGREYFDESHHSAHPFSFLEAYATALGINFDRGASSSAAELFLTSGLVRFGPQWDIDLVDTAFRGWTGLFLMARKDGNFIAVWPDDVDPGNRNLSFAEYLVSDPLELRLNHEIITNAIHAEGYEIREGSS